jgi:hypothetical protein
MNQLSMTFALSILSVLGQACSDNKKKDASPKGPKWDLIEFQPVDEATANPLVKQIFLSSECSSVPSVLVSFETKDECEASRTSYNEKSPEKVIDCLSGELSLSDERLGCKKL